MQEPFIEISSNDFLYTNIAIYTITIYSFLEILELKIQVAIKTKFVNSFTYSPYTCHK